MKEYTDQELKVLLLEDDYPNNETMLSGVISRIRSFGEPAAKMFEQWAEKGIPPKFEVEGVSSAFLKSQIDMKNVALIIAYDWLTKDPHEAARLLKKPIVVRMP